MPQLLCKIEYVSQSGRFAPAKEAKVSFYLFIYLFIYVFIYSFIHWFVYSFIYLFIYLFLSRPSVCQWHVFKFFEEPLSLTQQVSVDKFWWQTKWKVCSLQPPSTFTLHIKSHDQHLGVRQSGVVNSWNLWTGCILRD